MSISNVVDDAEFTIMSDGVR